MDNLVKLSLLKKIYEYRNTGYYVSKFYTMNDSIEEMEYELKTIENQINQIKLKVEISQFCNDISNLLEIIDQKYLKNTTHKLSDSILNPKNFSDSEEILYEYVINPNFINDKKMKMYKNIKEKCKPFAEELSKYVLNTQRLKRMAKNYD
jgi:hypothetical protein